MAPVVSWDDPSERRVRHTEPYPTRIETNVKHVFVFNRHFVSNDITRRNARAIFVRAFPGAGYLFYVGLVFLFSFAYF